MPRRYLIGVSSWSTVDLKYTWLPVDGYLNRYVLSTVPRPLLSLACCPSASSMVCSFTLSSRRFRVISFGCLNIGRASAATLSNGIALLPRPFSDSCHLERFGGRCNVMVEPFFWKLREACARPNSCHILFLSKSVDRAKPYRPVACLISLLGTNSEVSTVEGGVRMDQWPLRGHFLKNSPDFRA